MSAARKIAASVLPLGLVTVAIVVIFFAHQAIARRWPTHRFILLIPATRSRYLCVFARLLTIGYTTMTLTSLQLVQCVWINDKKLW